MGKTQLHNKLWDKFYPTTPYRDDLPCYPNEVTQGWRFFYVITNCILYKFHAGCRNEISVRATDSITDWQRHNPLSKKLAFAGVNILTLQGKMRANAISTLWAKTGYNCRISKVQLRVLHMVKPIYLCTKSCNISISNQQTRLVKTIQFYLLYNIERPFLKTSHTWMFLCLLPLAMLF